MKVLMISTDSRIFEPGSAVRERMKSYSGLIENLDIIVFSKTGKPKKDYLVEGVCAYATNSSFKLKRIIDAYNLGKFFTPDLITCQDPFVTGLVGVLLKREARVKLELQVHTDLFDPRFISFSFGNHLRSLIAKHLLLRADGVRVVSKRIGDNIIRAGVKLITTPYVLPIFVDSKKIKNSSLDFDLHKQYSQFKEIILMASRLAPEKNIDLALEVFSEIRKTRNNIGLVIAGDGPERSRLENKVKYWGLSEAVIFLGWREDLASLYKTADVFLQTSVYEGYGLSLVEATVSGLPVVSTDVGVASEFGACLANQKNDLAQCIYSQLGGNTFVKTEKLSGLEFSLIDYNREVVNSWRLLYSN